MEVKKTLDDSVVVTFMYWYGSETWTLLRGHKSRMNGAEMGYLRNAGGKAGQMRMCMNIVVLRWMGWDRLIIIL